MKRKGERIITDDDVLVTGTNNIGESLKNVVQDIDDRTKKLESNLKWIYQYGGVGGNGGGGSSSTSYTLYATLNGVAMSTNSIVALPGSGTYDLSIAIQIPNGATYAITYSIVDEAGNNLITPGTTTLTISNSYLFTKSITLTKNGYLSVTAVDSVYSITKQISQVHFITESYNFSTSLVQSSGTEYSTNEIFTSTAQSKGVGIKLTYNIAVESTEATFYMSFMVGDTTITKQVNLLGSSTTANSSAIYNLQDIYQEVTGNTWTIDESYSGNYTVSCYITLTIKNTSQVKLDSGYSKTFTLVPLSLYILVQPENGTLYPSKTSTVPASTFSTGNVVINLKGYYGSSTTSNCTIYYRYNSDLYDEADPTSSSYLEEEDIYSLVRVQSQISVYATRTGWNKLEFRITCDGVSYPTTTTYDTYYFYVVEPDNSIVWPADNRSGIKIINHWRGSRESIGEVTDTVTPFISLSSLAGNKGYIYQTANSNKIEVTDFTTIPGTDLSTYTTFFTVGLQYSEVNTESSSSSPNYIFECTSKKSGSTVDISVLRVTQNQVILNNGLITINYYLPKVRYSNFDNTKSSQYHLLNIISRFIKEDGNTNYYEIAVYVDGRIEGMGSTYSTEQMRIDKITINPENMLINLMELSYLQPITGIYDTRTVDSSFLPITKTVTVSEDIYAYENFIKYKNTLGILVDSGTNHDLTFAKNLLNYGSSMFSGNDGDVTCSKSVVDNIAASSKLPVMVLTIQTTCDTDPDSSTAGKIAAKTSLDSGEYGENDSLGYESTVYWSPGGAVTSKVSFPTGFDNAYFYAEIQGSSTKKNKCKNYDLSVYNKDTSETAPIYLYSPNFTQDNIDSFLPEKTFTLKADVVDSSHSNNTSIGKFVNDVTTKFSGSKGSGAAKLENHVKNCLEGFPILLFIQYVWADPSDNSKTKEICFYQGVYNFNLGRKSELNLGYVDTSILCDSSGNITIPDSTNGSFVFGKVTNKTSYALKSGLLVGEIQGNNSYFDFSQYDDSILWSMGGSDSLYMFGDAVYGTGFTSVDWRNIIKLFVKNISLGGGYLFETLLKKSMSTSKSDTYGYDNGYNGAISGISNNSVPNYRYRMKRDSAETGATHSLIEYLNESNKGTLSSLTSIVGVNSSEDIRPIPWLDFLSVSEYYTICMAFGLVDSVQKNMNIKCWNATESPTTGNANATFYTAFYDMDTSFGINNAGYDVNYDAFSDYWASNNTVNGDVIIPGSVTVYRDYSPKADTEETSNYYDTPSSYLFAIAKYARLAYNGDNDSITNDSVTFWPKVLWAKWRTATTTSSDPTQGCLSTADKFMENYFSNNLKDAGELMVNYDYRNKYFYMSNPDTDTSFNENNYKKFNGTRIYKAADWLNNRFHILDAYFNINNSVSYYKYYEPIYTVVSSGTVWDSNTTYYELSSSGSYIVTSDTSFNSSKTYYTKSYGSLVNVPYGSGYLYELNDIGSYSLSTNPDIIVLRDIFSENGEGSQGAGNLSFNIKTSGFSPLIISTANNNYRYLLDGGADKTYNINLSLSGNQTYIFGGSSTWTYLDSINSFGFKTLNVYSDLLSTLSGTKANSEMTVSTIDMPSLKDLTLSGSGYTGSFGTSGSPITKTEYPNLDTINLDTSAVSLYINTSDVSSISLASMKGANINIANCTNLSKLNLGTGTSTIPGTTLNSLTVTPVPSSMCTVSSSNPNGFRLNYMNITSVELSNTVKSGVSRLEVTNNSTLVNLTVTGFSQIYVYNCPKLESIIITDPTGDSGDKLAYLYVDSVSSSTSNSILIGTSTATSGTVDLRNYSSLSQVRISNCSNFTNLYLPANINILPSGFYNDRKLTTLDVANSGSNTGYANITGSATFYDCVLFKLEDSNGNQAHLKVLDSVTSLSSTFSLSTLGGSAITLARAKGFIESALSTTNSVTSIDSLFYGQYGIKYTPTELKTDLAGTTSLALDLSIFKNVSSATFAFCWCPITAWSKSMYTLGSNVSSLNINNIYRYTSNDVTTTIDVLTNIITKITSFGFNYSSGIVWMTLKFVDSSCNIIENPSIYDFFHPSSQNPSKITALYYLKFSTLHTSVNLANTFSVGWTSLTGFYGFLFAQNQTNYTGLSGLLNYSDLSNLRYIYFSFCLDNSSSPVDLAYFCNWDTLLAKGGNIFSPLDDEDYYIYSGSFGLYKFIRYDDYRALLATGNSDNNGFRKFTKGIFSYTLTGWDNIFRNCTLYVDSYDKAVIGFSSFFSAGSVLSNTYVTRADCMYYNFKAIQIDSTSYNATFTPSSVSGTEIPIYVTDIFQVAKKVKYARYTFVNVYMAQCLPYDFFGKRTSTSTTKQVINPDNPIAQAVIEDALAAGTEMKTDTLVGTDFSFTDTTTYLAGRIVLHDNLLYKFTSSHTGSWTGTDVTLYSNYDPERSYTIGSGYMGTRFVFYQGKLYRITSTMTGTWDSTKAVDYYSPFSTSYSYSTGDYVLYNGVFYKFTSSHTAGTEWTGTDASEVSRVIGDCIMNASVVRYTYTQEIGSLKRCFYGTRWAYSKTDTTILYDARFFHDMTKPNPNYIGYTNGDGNSDTYSGSTIKIFTISTISSIDSSGNTTTYTIYKLDSQGNTLGVNTELTDTDGIISDYTHTVQVTTTIPTSNYNIYDYSERVKNHLFIAPDILYGCVTSCSLIECFSNVNDEDTETLVGIIPEHFLKNCKSGELTNFLCNLNILPRYLGTYTGTNDTVNVYYYVPSNFTNQTNLSYGFNFHLMIPDKEVVDTSTGTEKRTYNKYYVLLYNSIPSTTTYLSYGLPSVSTANSGDSEHGWFTNDGVASSSVNIGVHYNIMFTPIYTNGVLTGGDDGIRLDILTKLYSDSLVTGNLSLFLNGLLFNSSTVLSNIASKKSTDSYVIYAHEHSSYSFITQTMKLPGVSSATLYPNTFKYIYFSNGSSLTISQQNINNGSSIAYSTYQSIKCNGKNIYINGYTG